MTVADELSKCAIVNRLRQELDKRGIEYRDDSSVMGELVPLDKLIRDAKELS